MTEILKQLLLFAASLLAGAIVCVVTMFAYAFTVPSCVADHAGFAFAMPGFLTGAVGGMITIIVGIRNVLRTWRCPAQVRIAVMNLLRFSGIAVVASYVAAFVLFGAVFHIFKHECHLTPWSP